MHQYQIAKNNGMQLEVAVAALCPSRSDRLRLLTISLCLSQRVYLEANNPANSYTGVYGSSHVQSVNREDHLSADDSLLRRRPPRVPGGHRIVTACMGLSRYGSVADDYGEALVDSFLGRPRSRRGGGRSSRALRRGWRGRCSHASDGPPAV